MLEAVTRSYAQFTRRFSTPELNSFFRSAVRAYKPPTYKGKSVYLGYITQEKTSPPVFAVLVNDPARVHFTYRRYLENRIREEFGLEGSAVVLRFKAKKSSRR
jgi:GTP-binding protein